MSISVGIDLGTTFSAVAYIDPKTKLPQIIPNSEGGKLTPSVIQFLDGDVIFGSEAEEAYNAGEEDCVTSFKREMGEDGPFCYINGKEYTSETLSSMLLMHLKADAEMWLGDTIKDVVITVPAYFYSKEREATIRAAKAAGLRVKKIIDEPNAAAMAYGLNHWRENANILVYDLGGGTFDVTLVHMRSDGELNTITTKGNHRLGGRDWDARLQAILLEKFEADTGIDLKNDLDAIALISGVSESVKKQLSAQNMLSTRVSISFPGYGKSTVTVFRKEFEENTADLLDQTGSLCMAALDEAQISKESITDVLLVGGSTRMPQVSEYLQKLFRKRPLNHVNPDEAVALGAAIQSSKDDDSYATLSVQFIDGKKTTDRRSSGLNAHKTVKAEKKLSSISLLSLRETTAHAMGMIAVSTDGTKYINEIIIPVNHPRPVKVAKAFSFITSSRRENEMEIFVLQGDKENPLDCLIPYRYVVTGIRHIREQRGKTTIKVQYSYDKNGIIKVEARQENDMHNLEIRCDAVPDDMSKYGLPISEKDSIPEPLSVVLAVDVSGSMMGQPLSDAQSAMCDFMKQMDFSYTQVGVLAVSDRTDVVCPLCDDEQQCINRINSITCGQTGYGNMSHPFSAIEEILKDADGRRFAIVLADGVWDRQDIAIAASKECNRHQIETAAIGFGGADYNFLKNISSEDANALFVSQGELTSAFGTIAQSLSGTSSANGDIGASQDIDTWE